MSLYVHERARVVAFSFWRGHRYRKRQAKSESARARAHIKKRTRHARLASTKKRIMFERARSSPIRARSQPATVVVACVCV